MRQDLNIGFSRLPVWSRKEVQTVGIDSLFGNIELLISCHDVRQGTLLVSRNLPVQKIRIGRVRLAKRLCAKGNERGIVPRNKNDRTPKLFIARRKRGKRHLANIPLFKDFFLGNPILVLAESLLVELPRRCVVIAERNRFPSLIDRAILCAEFRLRCPFQRSRIGKTVTACNAIFHFVFTCNAVNKSRNVSGHGTNRGLSFRMTTNFRHLESAGFERAVLSDIRTVGVERIGRARILNLFHRNRRSRVSDRLSHLGIAIGNFRRKKACRG